MHLFTRKPHLTWVDYVVLVLLPVLACWLTVGLKLHLITAVFLFNAAPGIYLAIRYGHSWQVYKSIFFTLIVATPLAIIVDFIGIYSKIWYTIDSVFPARFLGIMAWEDLLWMFTATFTILIIYEILFDKGKHEMIDRRMRYYIFSAALSLGVFFIIMISGNKSLLTWQGPYTYLILGTIFFLLPAILFLITFPKFLKRAAALVGYFTYVTFFLEFTATYAKQWEFTGQYLIHPLTLLGHVSVPYEELFFVGVIGPLAVIAFYEFFDDDRR